MNRRSFAQSMGSAAMLSAIANTPAWSQPVPKTALFRLEYVYVRQETQRKRVHELLASQIPLLKNHTTTLGVFTAITGPHIPATLVLSGFASFADMQAADEKISRDADARRSLMNVQAAADHSYEHSRVLLKAAELPDSQHIAAQPKQPRIFELRGYHSGTAGQLQKLHESLTKEGGVFARAGIHPAMYAETIVGPNMPNLNYLIPFADLVQRERAWDAVAADSAWAEGFGRAGEANIVADITLLRPTEFSPMQ